MRRETARLISIIRTDIRRNFAYYSVILILLMVGFGAGCRYRGQLSLAAAEAQCAFIMQSVLLIRDGMLNNTACFFVLLVPTILSYSLTIACCISVLLLPLFAVTLICKGFLFGFFIASLFGIDFFTALIILLSTLPLKSLSAIFFIKAGQISLKKSIYTVKRSSRRYKRTSLFCGADGNCIIGIGKCFIITALLIAAEAYLSMLVIGI